MIGGPARPVIISLMVRQPDLMAAVGLHDIDLKIPAAIGLENDSLSIRGPVRIFVDAFPAGIRDLSVVRAVGVDQMDLAGEFPAVEESGIAGDRFPVPGPFGHRVTAGLGDQGAGLASVFVHEINAIIRKASRRVSDPRRVRRKGGPFLVSRCVRDPGLPGAVRVHHEHVPISVKESAVDDFPSVSGPKRIGFFVNRFGQPHQTASISLHAVDFVVAVAIGDENDP
jgi:hypothetical protein